MMTPKEMDKVYLVFKSNFPDTDLIGIFSTKEKAEEFKSKKEIEEQSKIFPISSFHIYWTKIDEEYNNY